MTVPAKSPVIEYLEDGATLSFPFPFQFNDPSDLVVRRKAPGHPFADLDPATWSATGAGNPAGGVVILSVTVASATLKIRRETAIKQTASFPPLQPFPAKSNENALDRSTLIAQDTRAVVDDTATRALLAPEGGQGAVIAPNASGVIGFFRGQMSVQPVTEILSQTTTLFDDGPWGGDFTPVTNDGAWG